MEERLVSPATRYRRKRKCKEIQAWHRR